MSTDTYKRKLTAILSADVAGYSRLMDDDEVSTVRTLQVYQKIISDITEQHNGRVVDSPGDNLMVEFASVVDAVRCAVEIQQNLRIKNDELPKNRRMEFRVGNPYHPAFYIHNAGWAYLGLGRYDEAIVELKRALEKEPDNFGPMVLLASVYGNAGRLDEGRSLAAKIRKLDPRFSLASRLYPPYKYKADAEMYMNGLRKVGIPEKLPLSITHMRLIDRKNDK